MKGGGGNYQKTPLGSSFNRISREVAATAIQQIGRALPCSVVAVSGQIVTVKFEISTEFTIPQVTIPIAGAEYIRFPTQIGDKGFVLPADAYLGGISGLGGGVANLTPPMNLAALVFFPIGSKFFSSVNPNAVVIYGPDGVVLRDTGSAAVITLIPASITMTLGASSLTIAAGEITISSPVIALNGTVIQTAGSGTGSVSLVGPVNVTNDVVAGTVSLQNHLTSDVETGGGTSGPPVPGT
jgi:hypothetical protein